MSYQHDHMAWQQRCNQELQRKNQHDVDFMNDRIQPLTKSKFNPKNLNSSYTNFFGNLLTLDQKREYLNENDEESQYETANKRYTITQNAKKQFRENLQSNGNYSFGGVSPLYTEKRKAQSSLRTYMDGGLNNKRASKLRRQYANAGGDGPSQILASKSFQNVQRSFITPGGKSIYDLVQQKIDVPSGLLYRGKYCGKSRLRQKMHEFGDANNHRSNEQLSTVNPLMAGKSLGDSKAGPALVKSQKGFAHVSRNLIGKANRTTDKDTETNRLKQMKKFYPEEYFRRSGYKFEKFARDPQNDLVYFKPAQGRGGAQANKLNAEFNRFNEALEYPNTDKRSDGRSYVSKTQLDRMSNLSRKSKSQIGDMASKKQSLQSRVSSKILKDAKSTKSFQSKMRIQQPKVRPYTPEEAVRLIEAGRLRRTIIKDQGGQFSRARNVDEEALETENIRIHTEEDQPAAIQVEDDEFVAYYDEQTGCHYDDEGNFIELNIKVEEPMEEPKADDEVVTLDVNEYKDLKSYQESQVGKKVKKQRPKTAIQNSRKRLDSQARDNTRNNDLSKLSGMNLDQTRSQTGISQNKSAVSQSKSYISHLEQELNEERVARERLQSDIEQIKQMNSDITEKLGLNLGAGKA